MKKRRIVLAGILLLLVHQTGWGFFLRTCYEYQYCKYIQSLAAQGFPVSQKDLQKTYLPPGVANAAEVYLKAFSFYVDPNESTKKQLPLRGDYILPDGVPPFPPDVIEAIRLSLQDNRQTLELLDQAARLKDCQWPRTESFYMFYNDAISNATEAVELLCERNLYLAQNGQQEKTVASFESVFALTKTFHKQPTVVEFLACAGMKRRILSNLEDVLRSVQFSEPQLKKLQAEFGLLNNPGLLHTALVNDRCVHIDCLKVTAGNPFPVPGSLLNPIMFLYTSSWLGSKDKLLSLYYYQRSIQASLLLPHQRQRVFNQIDQELKRYHFIRIYLKITSFKEVSEIDARILGELCCAETALAVERYRLTYHTPPTTLKQLVPRFMAAVPRDPFDNEVLRYLRHDVGYTIYVIGDDGVDNGGISREEAEEQNGGTDTDQYDWPFTVKR